MNKPLGPEFCQVLVETNHTPESGFRVWQVLALNRFWPEWGFPTWSVWALRVLLSGICVSTLALLQLSAKPSPRMDFNLHFGGSNQPLAPIRVSHLACLGTPQDSKFEHVPALNKGSSWQSFCLVPNKPLDRRRVSRSACLAFSQLFALISVLFAERQIHQMPWWKSFCSCTTTA